MAEIAESRVPSMVFGRISACWTALLAHSVVESPPKGFNFSKISISDAGGGGRFALSSVDSSIFTGESRIQQ